MVHYLVKWKGYPLEEATWQPITNLENCPHEILKFQSSVKPLKPTKKRKGKQKFDPVEVFQVQTPIMVVKVDPSSISKSKDITAEPAFASIKSLQPQPSRMIELKPSSTARMVFEDHEEREDQPQTNEKTHIAKLEENIVLKQKGFEDQLKKELEQSKAALKKETVNQSIPEILELFEAKRAKKP